MEIYKFPAHPLQFNSPLMIIQSWEENMGSNKNRWIGIIIFSVLILTVGCSTSEEVVTYNINGTWNIALTNTADETMIWQITFTGGETNGTATDTYPLGGGTGIYTITGSSITLTMNYPMGPVTVTYNGSISSNNYMSGNWSSSGGPSGTWLATR
jgi:hypothetical protein